MDTKRESPVTRAIALVGGATKAAHAAGVSNAAVYEWINLGIVPRTRYAVLLSEATGGRVTVRELGGLDPLGPLQGAATVPSRLSAVASATTEDDDEQETPAASVGGRRLYSRIRPARSPRYKTNIVGLIAA